MTISVFGTAYVGLVTGACLAKVGHDVIYMGIDQDQIDQFNTVILPVWEAELDNTVPRNREDGSADWQCILAMARTITDRVKAQIQALTNPEYRKEGAAVNDFMKHGRIIIGTDSPAAGKLLRKLYGAFKHLHERTIFIDIRSAKLTRYAADSMLATNAGHLDYAAKLLESVDRVNEQQKNRALSKLAQYFGGTKSLTGKTIALWWLTFKPTPMIYAKRPLAL